MTRILPGVAPSLTDNSTQPEGQKSLTVGYVLKANRGPIGKCELVVNPTDFLTKYTFTGRPKTTDDSTFHSILKDLVYTNQMYISRAAKNALYGGLTVKAETALGNIVTIDSEDKKIIIAGDVTTLISVNDIVRVKGASAKLDGRYKATGIAFVTPNTEITTTDALVEDFTYASGAHPQAYKTVQPVSFKNTSIGAVVAVTKESKMFAVTGDVTDKIIAGDKIELKNSALNKGIYTVASRALSEDETKTEITVNEVIAGSTADGTLYRNCIVTPETYSFATDDLFLLTGIDQGGYNANIEIEIVSSKETALAEAGVFTLTIYDNTTNAKLESFMVSRDREAKAIDGTALYIEDVINESSAYIQVVDNADVAGTELPCNTITNVSFSGGYDGDALTDVDMVAALELFADKTIPISILGNGSAENELFHGAMIALLESRKDAFGFLNSRLSDEKATLNSTKAQNIVKYKKETLASTSFYAGMYASHVKVPDVYNSRTVTIGADAIAIAGWLNILGSKGYPYAYAGPTEGLVNGAKCDWKIGDESGEATLLNDASINYVAYDPKQGRYYMQTQNTLQIANSALRNEGTVLNILDIKETLAVFFKEFLQKPITTSLRQQMLDKGKDVMNLAVDQDRFTNYVFQETSSKDDLSKNILRFLLTLSPTSYAQNIYLAMNIVNQTYDFSILQSI